jgi:hypothetical protein
MLPVAGYWFTWQSFDSLRVHRIHLINYWVMGLYFFSICLILLYWNSGKKNGREDKGSFPFQVFIFSPLFLQTWLSFMDLPNWATLVGSGFLQSPQTYLLIPLAIVFVTVYMLGHENSGLPRWALTLFFFLFIFLFFVLSFRSDALFQGSSEFHWEYYTGPVRSLRNGGLLLWSVPSQYGFLSILWADLFKAKTVWQSFYLAQGVLLFITSILVFRLNLGQRRDLIGVLFTGLVTFASLHFADADMIGPSLYPSSSVMRFFWCYALLFIIFSLYGNKKEGCLKKFSILGGTVWILGTFWAAESFVYCSAIFWGTYLFCLIQELSSDLRGKRSISIGKYLFPSVFPLAGLLCTILLINAIYGFSYNVSPDWFMHFEHALSYAAGFGSVPLFKTGAVWLLVFLFVSLFFIIHAQSHKDFCSPMVIVLVGNLFALWAIGSYFVGRSVPHNITAILPLICVILFSTLHALRPLGLVLVVRLPFLISCLSLFVFVLWNHFGNPQLVETWCKLRTWYPDVSVSLRPMTPELRDLAGKAGLKPDDPVAYCGFPASMPRWPDSSLQTSEYTWVQNPLQLSEEPIKAERQKIFVNRFFQGTRRGGWLVHDKNFSKDRYPIWLALFSEHWNIEKQLTKENWEITKFFPKFPPQRN